MPTNSHTAATALAPSPDTAIRRQADLDELAANPHLWASKLVETMNRNNGFDTTVRADLAAALDRAALAPELTGTEVPSQRQAPDSRPRPLAGSVVITRNRTSAAQVRDLSFAPTAPERAAILAGEHLAHDLLASGMPDDLAAQADAIAHYIDPICKAYEVRKLERRGVSFAEAAARHFINHCQPTDLVFTRTSTLIRWHAEQRDVTEMAHVAGNDETLAAAGFDTDVTDADEVSADGEAAARLVRRPRLAWTHPDGPEHGFMLDRVHHTHMRDVIERDTWIRRKVTEDLVSIDAFLAAAPGPATTPDPRRVNLGVRVHAHRAPHVGIHFLPDYTATSTRPILGAHHRIGGCKHCATRLALPNSNVSAHTTTVTTDSTAGAEAAS